MARRCRCALLVAAALGVAGVALLFLPELLAARSGRRCGHRHRVRRSARRCSRAPATSWPMRNQRVGIPTFPGTAWGMLYGAARRGGVRRSRGSRRGRSTRGPRTGCRSPISSLVGSIVAFGAYLTLLKRVGAGPVVVRRRRDAGDRADAVDAVRRLSLDAGRRRGRRARRDRQRAGDAGVGAVARAIDGGG